MSSSSFVVMEVKRVGCKVAFAGRGVSGGITGALYLYRSRERSGRVG